jgi:hypothetical protein
MRHRFDAGFLFDLFGDLDGLAAGAASGAIGHGNEGWVELAQTLDRGEKIYHAGLVLGGEKLERKNWGSSTEEIFDFHGAIRSGRNNAFANIA